MQRSAVWIGIAATAVIAGLSLGEATAQQDGALASATTRSGTQQGALATTAISFKDVWIVGHEKVPGEPRGTLARHWDGTWTTVTTPDPGTKYNDLTAVSGSSADDVWAVGDYRSGGTQDRGLAEHWDGTAWTSVPMPQPPADARVSLDAVVALAPDDAWVVGSTSGKERLTIAQHWDGSAWSDVAGFPEGVALNGVAGTEADDVWAVGSLDNEPYVAHWDGGSWTTVEAPHPPAGHAVLRSVSAVSSTDVWAVGARFDTPVRPYLLHWDGHSWRRSTPGHLRTTWSELSGVSAVAADDVWAVGYSVSKDGREKTLTEHWDNSRWTVVHSPNPLPRNQLLSVAALADNDAWTVGNDNFWQVIALHWNGRRWTNG